MLSVADYFNSDLSTTCEEVPRYSEELVGQMTNGFVAFCHFYSKFIHGVVEHLFSNKFLPNCWLPNASINEVSAHKMINSVCNKMRVSVSVVVPRLLLYEMPGYLAITSYHFTRGIRL